MDKKSWITFLSSKVRSQIAFDNSEKAQKWALILLAMVTLGFALSAVSQPHQAQSRYFIFSVKVIALILVHATLVFGFFIPSLLQKGEKPLARIFKVRDFSGLVAVATLVFFYQIMVTMLSFQVLGSLEQLRLSDFFGFVVLAQVALSCFYLVVGAFYFTSLVFFPNAFLKVADRGAKTWLTFTAIHSVMIFMLGFGYTEIGKIGAPDFLENLRVSGLFWIALVSALFMVAKMLSESAVAALNDLELEVTSGRLERTEDILARYKTCFVSGRLAAWLHRNSHFVDEKSHEIANFAHEALTLVEREKPTEMDLRKVEECYRKADQTANRLEKQNQRFAINVSMFDLSDVEQDKVAEVRDKSSRELRNAKLELLSVRKKIDEKLAELKAQTPAKVPAPKEVPVEKIPVSK